MVEYLSDLRLLLAISRTLNFRAAGAQLGYSPAVVTTRMQRLETVTGKTLFTRSTRRIALTEDGLQTVRTAEQILELADHLGRASGAATAVGPIRGAVRLSAPHSFARVFLVEPVIALLRRHPELTIDLVLEDSLTPLAKEGIDISFRVGGRDESNTDSHDLIEDRRILVASPAYLADRGVPASPPELRAHRLLAYPGVRQWTLQDGQRSYRLPVRSPLHCNTGDTLSQFALAGAGIAVKSDWSVQRELDAGALTHVLPGYCVGPQRTVRALLSSQDYRPVRVTAVLDFLREQVRNAARPGAERQGRGAGSP